MEGLGAEIFRQPPVPIHYPVAGQVGPHRFVKGPPDGAGGPAPPEVLGDVAVGGDAAQWNLGTTAHTCLKNESPGSGRPLMALRLRLENSRRFPERTWARIAV